MVRVYAKDLLVIATRSTLVDILYNRLQDCTLKTWESSAEFTRMHITSTKDTGYDIDQEVITGFVHRSLRKQLKLMIPIEICQTFAKTQIELKNF